MTLTLALFLTALAVAFTVAVSFGIARTYYPTRPIGRLIAIGPPIVLVCILEFIVNPRFPPSWSTPLFQSEMIGVVVGFLLWILLRSKVRR